MDQPTVKIPVGGVLMLHPMFMDQTGRPLKPQPAVSTVTFSSDAPAVATVSDTGLITALTAGSVNISAVSGSVNCSKSITVYIPVATKIVM